MAHNLIIECLINVSLQCPVGLCHLQTGRWRLLVHLSCAALPGAAVSSSPLHVLYSSLGGMSSNTASDLWSPPNSHIEAEELHLQWDLMGKLVGIFFNVFHTTKTLRWSHMSSANNQHKLELQAGSSSFEWSGTPLSHSPKVWLLIFSAWSLWSSLHHHLISTELKGQRLYLLYEIC